MKTYIDKMLILHEAISLVIATQEAGPHHTPSPTRLADFVAALYDVEVALPEEWQIVLYAMRAQARQRLLCEVDAR